MCHLLKYFEHLITFYLFQERGQPVEKNDVEGVLCGFLFHEKTESEGDNQEKKSSLCDEEKSAARDTALSATKEDVYNERNGTSIIIKKEENNCDLVIEEEKNDGSSVIKEENDSSSVEENLEENDGSLVMMEENDSSSIKVEENLEENGSLGTKEENDSSLIKVEENLEENDDSLVIKEESNSSLIKVEENLIDFTTTSSMCRGRTVNELENVQTQGESSVF